MSPEEINTQIRERFRQLPPKLQDAITSADLSQKIKEIVKKHNLLIDEGGILEREVLFILLGLEPSSEFVDNISKELGLNKEEVTAIAEDVNTLIFDGVRTHLREIEESVKAAEAESETLNKDATVEQTEMAAEPVESTPAKEVTRESLKRDMEEVAGITIHDETMPAHQDQGPTIIENREARPEKKVEPPENLPGRKEIVGMTDIHTDSLPDHLISAPLEEENIVNPTVPVYKPQNIAANTTSDKPPVSTGTTVPTYKPSTPAPVTPPHSNSGDPYREQIK